MFDNNVFIKDSCRNITEEDIIVGYELQTLITYYRAIPLSMLEYICVERDGIMEDKEDIMVSVDKNDWFTLKEVETVTSYKWEYGDPLFIRINKMGGLAPGEHSIKLVVATRTAYIPVPLEGSQTRKVLIEG